MDEGGEGCPEVPQSEPANTQEGIERLFLDLCDEAGIPRPETNVFVEGYNVDAVWRALWTAR